MPHYTRKSSLLLILLLFSNFLRAQKNTQEQPKDGADYVNILFADHAMTHEKYPGQQLLSGNVQIEMNGAKLFCDKAIVNKTENTAIAVGHVRMEQGDTIHLKSEFLKYEGNTSHAEAIGKVVLTDPRMTLTTDTLSYDRKNQEAYYTTGGHIRDSINTLDSKIGRYFLNEKRVRFINNVKIVNPDYKIESYQLDYYTDSGISDFTGPTKIYNSESYVYAEKGHHNSKTNISWFVKNAFIKRKNNTIKADSLYYDRNIEYATGNKNVVLFDSINNTWIYTDYAQRWAKQDSVRVSEHPLVVSVKEKDTLYIRAQQFIAAGKENERKLWGYKDVKFYSKDFSGRSDSLYRDDKTRLMKLLNQPIVWSGKSQITGEVIHIKNDSLNQLDSLMIPKDVFIIQKDSIDGFNQIKGKKLLGKFIEGQLHDINIYGNTEVIYYLREEDGELTGIEKNKSSRIFIEFEDNHIKIIRFYKNVDGTIYPKSKLPKNEQKFKGFVWHADKMIKTKEDVIEDKQLDYQSETKQKPTSKEDMKQLGNDMLKGMF
jgi:lipopolysaccharide export system protein LptA